MNIECSTVSVIANEAELCWLSSVLTVHDNQAASLRALDTKTA